MANWIHLPGTGLTPLMSRIVALSVALDCIEALVMAAKLDKNVRKPLHSQLNRFESLRQCVYVLANGNHEKDAASNKGDGSHEIAKGDCPIDGHGFQLQTR